MPTPKIVTWILVADGARAHIVAHQGPGKGLEAVLSLENANSRTATRDLGADRPGRVHESADSARHSMAPRVDWHSYEKHLFAKSMAKRLDQAALEKKFDRLILVAPPHTLGELRAALHKQTREKVSAELNKDLTNMSVQDLSAPLSEILAV